jgi:hypothetical protein
LRLFRPSFTTVPPKQARIGRADGRQVRLLVDSLRRKNVVLPNLRDEAASQAVATRRVISPPQRAAEMRKNVRLSCVEKRVNEAEAEFLAMASEAVPLDPPPFLNPKMSAVELLTATAEPLDELAAMREVGLPLPPSHPVQKLLPAQSSTDPDAGIKITESNPHPSRGPTRAQATSRPCPR